MSLPKEVNYMDKSELPKGTTSQTIVITPQTGNLTYNASGQLIQFNLPIRGYMLPSSLYLRYKMSIATTGTFGATSCVNGSFPAYSPFLRMETLIGSNVVESISNYNMLNQMIMTCKTNYGRKFGVAAMMGVGSGANTAFTTVNCNAYTPTAGTAPEDIFVAIPVNCLFGNADKLVPLKFMPATSLNFYLDAVGNFCSGGANAPTTIGLSNCELCFDIIEFGSDVDGAVLSMVDERGKLVLKSQSYMVSQQNVAAGITGTNEYIYSMRLASIKSLFLNIGGVAITSINKTFDSFDVTSRTGSYQFFIAGTPYPSREISTILNRGAVLAELAMAIDGTSDPSQANFSITPAEFKQASGDTTTALIPAKFYVGTNVERLPSSAMLTGISSQLSPISVRLVNSTASAAAHTMALIAHYDVLIEIDPINRQAVVLQ